VWEALDAGPVYDMECCGYLFVWRVYSRRSRGRAPYQSIFGSPRSRTIRVYPEMRLRFTLKSTRTAARKRAQGFPRPGVRKIAEQFQVDPSTVQKISARVIFADL
jgi:hypothetical protein